MKLSTLGEVVITATPKPTNPEIFTVSILCQHKQEPITLETQKDETVDQFARRVGSALRALVNAQERAKPAGAVAEEKPVQLSYEEQKRQQEAARRKTA